MESSGNQKESKQKKSVKCNKCDKTISYSYLNKHILAIHEKKNYACDKCKKVFTQKTNLRTHILTKHEGKKISM